MQAYRVTCIGKAVQDPPGGITHIGNVQDRWLMERATVIQHLELGTAAFYVLDEQTGQQSAIGFARESGRPPHLFSHSAGRCNAQLDKVAVLAAGPPRPV